MIKKWGRFGTFTLRLFFTSQTLRWKDKDQEHMDLHGNIGLYSYLFAFIAYSILTALLVSSWQGRQLGKWMILASSLSMIWAGIFVALRLFTLLPREIISIAELTRDVSWCIFLLKVIGLDQDQSENSADKPHDTRLQAFNRLILYILVTFSTILTILTITPAFLPSAFYMDSIEKKMILITWVALSVIGLLLIEQLFRNANVDERWAIKYLCLGLGIIFAYDFFMYADALLFEQLNQNLWDARGIVNGLVVPLIAISAARNPNWSLGIQVSRHIVFHSVTLIGTGVYLLIMITVGYIIRVYGGTWGGVLQIVFLCGTGMLLLVLLFSVQVRKKISLFLSKHFFSFKYDYRQEWLKFTHTLGMRGGSETLPERVVRAIAELIDSDGGMLWIKGENSHYELLARWNMPEPEATTTQLVNSLSDFIEQHQETIDLDEYSRDPMFYEGLELYPGFYDLPDVWLVIPLQFKQEILGIVLIRRSKIQKTINWEDRDLLKMAGQQAAMHLAQYQADQALIQARQFEAFNRLSAYIVHDLKNILAQQSLIISNAEKHKHNPAFVDDVISTIKNSVDRMSRLMKQMKSGMRGSMHETFELSELLSKVLSNCSNRKPIPSIESIETGLFVQTDRDQLATVFGHIIQNAQEATPKDGKITLKLSHNLDKAIVKVKDTGLGMDTDFIKNRLFRPFDSTKGLTGMGIGVFESREFIRSLGGEINVSSTPGSGSIFNIVIPCTKDK